MKNSLLIYVCDAAGRPAEWLRILPIGKVELKDSREPFEVDAESMAAIVTHFQAGGTDLVVDYEHQSLSGDRAPAAGWIKELLPRSDGLYARIEWTATALRYLTEGEYRYYSPVLRLDPKTRRPLALLHLALTNNPAMKGGALSPLLAAKYGESEVLILRDFTAAERKQAAQEGEAMPDGSFPIKSREDVANAVQAFGRAQDKEAVRKHIIARAKALGCMDLLPADWPGSTKKMEEGKPMKNKLLGLPGLTALKAESTDDEVIAALTVRLKQADSLPEIARAAGLEVTATAPQIKGAVLALKQGSEQLATLRTDLEALKAEQTQGKAQKAVDEALKAKKITPAQTVWALKYAGEDPEGFKTYVAAAPEILAGKELKQPAGGGGGQEGLDADQLALCATAGIKPEAFKASQKQLVEQGLLQEGGN